MTVTVAAPPNDVLKTAAQSRRRRNTLIRLSGLAGFLLLWEIVGWLTPRIFLAPFHETVVAFVRMTLDGTLIEAAASSIFILLVGLALSGVIGVVIGLAMGRYRRAQWVLEPYVNGLYATPTIAFLPLLMLWLGLFTAPKIAIVVLIAVFPVIKNVFAGVGTVGQEMLEPAESMKASEFQIFTKVIVPATTPFIMAGMRLAVGRAVVGVVVAEFFTAQSGLGGMIVKAASTFKTAEMFVPVIMLLIVGLSLTALVDWAYAKIAPWKESERDSGA